MTPDEAKNQARFLARQAQEHGKAWPRLSSQRYAGEQVVRTAYSTYRVIDGRCIVVQRMERASFASEGGGLKDDEQHECLGLHLIGYLNRHDDPQGVRWTLHAAPRTDSKAVFWRATQSGTGHFVVTSRIAPSVVPPVPTGSVAAGRATPPPLPKRPLPLKTTAPTPTTGVELRVAARPPLPPTRRTEAQWRGAEPRRVGTQVMAPPPATPPPPPPRCMKP